MDSSPQCKSNLKGCSLMCYCFWLVEPEYRARGVLPPMFYVVNVETAKLLLVGKCDSWLAVTIHGNVHYCFLQRKGLAKFLILDSLLSSTIIFNCLRSVQNKLKHPPYINFLLVIRVSSGHECR